MSLGHALNNAYSGLTVSSRRAEVTSHNIANASTPGYVKRSLEVASVALDGRGSGVEAVKVELASRPDLTAARRLADASAAGAEEIANASQTLARLIGEPEDPGSLTERFEALETSLRRVSDDPSATHLQTDAVNSAKDLVQGFDDIQSGLLDLRRHADREIGLLVDTVNQTLHEIDEINADIRKQVGVAGDTTELIAQRDRLIDKITEILPVKTYPSPNDGIIVTTDTGYTLVTEGSVHEIGFTAAPVVTAEMDRIGGNPGPLSGLTLHTQDVTPPASSVLATGRLAALFQVRDIDTVDFQNKLDAMAKDVIDRFEAVDGVNLGLFVDPSVTRAADLNELTLNLPSSATAAAGAIYSHEVAYYDATGAAQTLTVEFETTGVADQWTMRVYDSALDPAANQIAEHTLDFDAAGDLSAVADVLGPVFGAATAGAIELPVNGGANTVTLELGVVGAAGFLSQRNETFGEANVPAATKGLAGRIALNAAVDPAKGGLVTRIRDGLGATTSVEAGQNAHTVALLKALSVAEDAPAGSGLTGAYTAFSLVAGVSSFFSTKMLADEETLTLRSTRQLSIETAETSMLGVDLDYELQELNQIQTAYAANAKVMQTIDEMLARLLEI